MRYGVRCGHERSAIRSNGWLQAARAAPFLSGRQGRPARCVRRLALIWRCLVDSRVKEERRFLMSTEVRGALHFDCAHGSSISFLWHMGPGGISVQGLFLERQSRFLRFASRSFGVCHVSGRTCIGAPRSSQSGVRGPRCARPERARWQWARGWRSSMT